MATCKWSTYFLYSVVHHYFIWNDIESGILGSIVLLTSLTHFLESNHSQKLHPEVILLCVIAWFWPNYPWSNSSWVNRINDFYPSKWKEDEFTLWRSSRKREHGCLFYRNLSAAAHRPHWSSACTDQPLLRLNRKLQSKHMLFSLKCLLLRVWHPHGASSFSVFHLDSSP